MDKLGSRKRQKHRSYTGFNFFDEEHQTLFEVARAHLEEQDLAALAVGLQAAKSPAC